MLWGLPMASAPWPTTCHTGYLWLMLRVFFWNAVYTAHPKPEVRCTAVHELLLSHCSRFLKPFPETCLACLNHKHAASKPQQTDRTQRKVCSHHPFSFLSFVSHGHGFGPRHTLFVFSAHGQLRGQGQKGSQSSGLHFSPSPNCHDVWPFSLESFSFDSVHAALARDLCVTPGQRRTRAKSGTVASRALLGASTSKLHFLLVLNFSHSVFSILGLRPNCVRTSGGNNVHDQF